MSKCPSVTSTGRKKLPEHNYIPDGKSYLSNVETVKKLGVIVFEINVSRTHCLENESDEQYVFDCK